MVKEKSFSPATGSEVEVVAWTTPHMLDAMREPDVICGTMWPKELADLQSVQASVALVTKASYDALAAAKDEAEKEAFALAANQCHAGYSGEHGDHMCKFIDRAEAAERQLVDAQALLAIALDEHDSHWGEIIDPNCPHWSVAARIILKDEGSARL